MNMDVGVLEKYEKELTSLAQLVVSNPMDAKQSALEVIHELRQLRSLPKKNIQTTLARAYSIITTAEIRLGEYDNALKSAEITLDLYTYLNKKEGVARSYVNKGIVNGIIGKHHLANELFNQALPLFRECGDKSREAQTLVFIGNTFAGLGDYASALRQYNLGLYINQEIQDKQGISDALVNLGLSFQRMGEFTKAIDYYNQSFSLKREIGDIFGEARVLQNIATIHLSQGQFADAVKILNECKTIFENIKDKQGLSMVHTNIGAAHLRLGDYSRAMVNFESALTIQKEIGDTVGEARSLAYLGSTFLRLKDNQGAIEKYQRALELQKKNSDTSTISQTLLGLGSAYLEDEQYDNAQECFSQSLTYQQSAGDRFGASRSLGNLCRICLQRLDYEKALEYLQQAMIFHKQLSDREGEAESLIYLGELSEKVPEQVLVFSGQYEMYSIDEISEVIYKQALGIAQDIGSKNIEQSAFSHLSELYEQRGQYKESFEYFKKSLEIERSISNTETSEKMAFLHSVFEAEQAKKEAEIYRLRNVELARLNNEIMRQSAMLQEQSMHIEKTNRELRKKNKLMQAYLVEKDKMLGLVAHDLKSPISGVRMIGEFISSSYKQLGPEMMYELGNDIKSSTSRMFDTISNLLEIQELEAGKQKPVMKKMDLTDALRSAVAQYTDKASLKGIVICEYYPSTPCIATLDYMYCVRIVKNLLSNAIKYSPHHETVSVELNVVISTSSRKGRIARITVKDHGPGILSDEMPKLFKKFTKLSARPTGGEHSSGIGLSIVKQMVESQGGKVFCDSVPEQGATFIVEFPMSH
ncbi:MAG TPA: tetratricopeptide repeat protein [Candidatus Kapabacteria bacterium]|jgi:signal transduction histidine kinase/Tfp pilus assembly protein PilF|nr:tetratricopeptide repeat protein [Ignavibacteria bacterium]HRE56283.1 tetratricopeptide repeat protein [Candidatus Kapabacteria bacterium]